MQQVTSSKFSKPNLFYCELKLVSLVYQIMELNGTTAVITGASGRLGSAVAKALAKAGCNCICHYHHNSKVAEELVEQIRGFGVKALAVEADLVEPPQIEDLFEKAEQFDIPQILVNSAAVFSRQSLEKITFEEAQRVLNLNLIAPIMISQAFTKKLNERFTPAPVAQRVAVGKIINIVDIGGIRPWAEYVLYCSSKAGLIGATKALAKELAPRICVNSIAVGIVDWPGNFAEEEKKRQLSFIPAGRFAKPGEVAGAIIFLLKNDYITGQVLNIDGGRCI